MKVLVLDTEVHSNTGRPGLERNAARAEAKFAADAKRARKDLAWIAMGMGDAYVARVPMASGPSDRGGYGRGRGLPGSGARHRL